MIMKSLELKVPELQELLEKLELIKINLQAENQKNQINEEWLDNDQVVKILRISKRTLQTYRDRSILPFSQIGRKIYYKSAEIQGFLEDHHMKVTFKKGGQL